MWPFPQSCKASASIRLPGPGSHSTRSACEEGRSLRPGTRRSVSVPIKPRKLGHTVIGTVNFEAAMRVFTEGIGFRVSDYISDKGALMRCSVDHNVLALAAPRERPASHLRAGRRHRRRRTRRQGHARKQPRTPHLGPLPPPRRLEFLLEPQRPAGNFSDYYSDEIWTPKLQRRPRALQLGAATSRQGSSTGGRHLPPPSSNPTTSPPSGSTHSPSKSAGRR